MKKNIHLPYPIEEKPDGLMWKETDYHKQKELEKKNPVFERGGRK